MNNEEEKLAALKSPSIVADHSNMGDLDSKVISPFKNANSQKTGNFYLT